MSAPFASPKTIVYKTVGKLEILLDLHLPPNQKRSPVLLWFHGGGLLQGHRNTLLPYMRKAVQTYNLAVVSADYRFAPQVGVSDVFEDVQDCIKFIRTDLSLLLDDGVIDPTRLAVSGGSAGGYLAIAAGLYVQPKPNVILPLYPITDPLGTFFTKPQDPPGMRPLKSMEELGGLFNPHSEVITTNEDDSLRQYMYRRMLHDASLASLWKVPEDEEGAKRWRLSRCVYEQRVPPTYIIQGDAGESYQSCAYAHQLTTSQMRAWV